MNRRKDGSVYAEEMTITPIADGQNRITNYIAIKQDVTARRQAQELLRRSEERLKEAQQLARLGYIRVVPGTGTEVCLATEEPIHVFDAASGQRIKSIASAKETPRA